MPVTCKACGHEAEAVCHLITDSDCGCNLSSHQVYEAHIAALEAAIRNAKNELDGLAYHLNRGEIESAAACLGLAQEALSGARLEEIERMREEGRK